MQIDPHSPLAAPVAAYHARHPQRTWSLIVSFLGDAVLPRGGAVRAGTIGAFCGLAGIEPGLVRTALSRLVARKLLMRERIGRNSFYRLVKSERVAFAEAADLIYGRRLPKPTGGWDLVTIDAVTDRGAARAALLGAGFGAIGPATFLRPTHAGRSVHAPPGALVFQTNSQAENRTLCAALWPVDDLHQGYLNFGRLFAPFQEPQALSPADALLARVLLVHEFRRLALKDPFLPADVLPPGWPGETMRSLFNTAHAALSPAAERWHDEEITDI